MAVEKPSEDGNVVVDQQLHELLEFINLAAHDLISPARKVAAYADMLEESLGEPADPNTTRALAALGRSAGQMERTVTRLLAYSKLRQHDYAPKKLPLGPLVEEIIAAEFEGQPHGGRIDTSGVADSAFVDPALLSIALREVLRNAYLYRGDNEMSVRILSTQDTSGAIELTVVDRGIGVADKHHSKLFSPLFMLHPKHKFNGTGLGLAIAARAIAMGGGTISARSNEPTGLIVKMTFPPEPL